MRPTSLKRAHAAAFASAACTFALAWACTPTAQQKGQIAMTGPPATELLFCVLGTVPQCLRSGQSWAVCAIDAAHACSADETEIWRIWSAHLRAIYQQDSLDGGPARLSDAGAP
jgi:hypothetical protein